MNTYNLTWNQTLKLNYATFTHYCRYIAHKNTEAKIQAKKEARKRKRR